ncbi:MAG: 3-dehydro-L-gulonate 2-dehydrogenase [Candidatus Latescibacterota bacterium]|nr:3-dehydro-L-gulonate 2-dehydrogenase [Candidatus Latescibacterota bacterium]
MPRIPYDDLFDHFHRVLGRVGFCADRSRDIARIFADNTRDGVSSHGVNRFAGFVRDVHEGRVDRAASPRCVAKLGVLDQWDGMRGPGMLNATAAMTRAIEIARERTLGGVALRNTNHWMRAATYGILAARAGCIGLSWTNTTKLMPPHGAVDKRLGNNPLCIAIPGPHDDPVVLDMAMSQFSTGRTQTHQRSGEPLPVPGGYDEEGELTTDANAVLHTGRPLPIGYWKGSGLALCLDLIAALLSAGLTTRQLALQDREYSVSQLFLAIDLASIGDPEAMQQTVADTLDDLTTAHPAPGMRVGWPGLRTAEIRRRNLAAGVPVDEKIWKEILAL